MILGPRKGRILKAIVDEYIRSAEPVASKHLAERWQLDVSTATIRNEMSELETMGLLEQPHTSAGRVPSPAGYRFYVDGLMRSQRLSVAEMEAINNAMRLRLDKLDQMLSEVGRLAANLTQHAAYAVPPSRGKEQFERFALFRADSTTYVCVVVTTGKQVRSRAVTHSGAVCEAALASLSASLNEFLPGLNGTQVTAEIIHTLEAHCGTGKPYLPAVMEVILEPETEQKVVVEGSTHLLEHPEYRDIAKAQRMLEYLSDRRNLSQIPAPDPERAVNIVIGPENAAEVLKDSSVVMATYHVGDMRGFIGLIGPTRMDYSRVVSRLSYVAKRMELLMGNEE
jgi:heat-inducible transcriptional repressor